MIITDPVTRQRFIVDDHCGDFVYDKKMESSDPAVTHESVPLIGTWSDYTGSGGPNTKVLMMNPLPDQNKGTDAESSGRLGNLNEVGQDANLVRRRVKREYVEL